MSEPFAARRHSEMQEVLMDSTARGPEIHYYMIRGGQEKKNITIWESGTIGGEYIKSYGHYHRDTIIETYTILHGEGIVLLQERVIGGNGQPINDEIASIRAITVKAGDQVIIPPHAGHLAINTGSSWLVTSDDSPVNLSEENAVSAPHHADYEPFKQFVGAAYYVVNKNNEIEFIKNSHYKTVPPIIVEGKK